MKIYNRKSQSYFEEVEYQKELLEFLYSTTVGRLLLKLFIAKPFFSKLKSRYQKSCKSKKDIKPFIEQYQVDINSWNVDDFHTFNDFFIRKKDYHTDTKYDELIAIADGKLSIYAINDTLTLNVKGSTYTIFDILQDNIIANEYKNGTCLVFRLSVNDYHRYVFLDNGTIEKSYRIKGELHTVRPVSSKYNVYSRNCRQISILDTQHFGKVVQIEVGAMLVGKINNHDNIKVFSKLQEKGYFEYGGSTIILLFNKDISIDNDILMQSKNRIETQVHIGERIGKIV